MEYHSRAGSRLGTYRNYVLFTFKNTWELSKVNCLCSCGQSRAVRSAREGRPSAEPLLVLSEEESSSKVLTTQET